MNKVLIGAMALSLLGATAASAQPMPDRHDGGGDMHSGGDMHGDHMGGDRRDGDRMGGDRMHGDRHDGDRMGGNHWRRHHTRTVCKWRHHRKVCWQQRGWHQHW